MGTSGGVVVGRVLANDNDYELNGKEKFENVFELISQTGEIKVILGRFPDYEDTNEFLIEVTAKDFGSPYLKTNKSIKIVVTDTNDNSPIFTKDIYQMKIK